MLGVDVEESQLSSPEAGKSEEGHVGILFYHVRLTSLLDVEPCSNIPIEY